jgi:hypothetical protein
MSHIVFFSYARERLDRYLKDFFDDLCEEIAQSTKWPPHHEEISFRDTKNLRLMENWRTHIEGALQSSSVLVCITETAYLNREFCGREYYVFDQRRRQGLKPGTDPPPVILPIIWTPVYGGLPEYMKSDQQLPKDIETTYLQLGLRRLRKEKPRMYERCVMAFADAIVNAWRTYKIPRLPGVQDFAQIPNQFADTEWAEAAGSTGWLSGPEVANFVFAAGSSEDFPQPAGRYGTRASEWRPYLPPHPDTILHHAKKAARSFKFRELPVDEHLERELEAAKDRKNLTVLLADPHCLDCETLAPIRNLEKTWWDGTGIILPFNDPVLQWKDPEVQNVFQNTFPVLSQTQAQNIRANIMSGNELQLAIETTLADLCTAVIRSEADKKKITDQPPPGLTSMPGAGH